MEVVCVIIRLFNFLTVRVLTFCIGDLEVQVWCSGISVAILMSVLYVGCLFLKGEVMFVMLK